MKWLLKLFGIRRQFIFAYASKWPDSNICYLETYNDKDEAESQRKIVKDSGRKVSQVLEMYHYY